MPARAFAIAAVLIAAPAAGKVAPDGDVEELAAAFPSFREGLLRYGHHVRLRGHSRPTLLKYGHRVRHGHRVHQEAQLEAELLAEVNAELADGPVEDASPPMTLPGRHPSVERALDGMAGDLQTLKEEQLMAMRVRGELEGSVTDAVHHMNDVVGIRHDVAQKEARLRIEDGKLRKLESDVGRLAQTRSSLLSSLQRMLVPKLLKARERLEKKETALRKEEQVARLWKAKNEQTKASAMESVRNKKASHQRFSDAEAELAEARKKEKLARMQYEHDVAQTSERVQSFRYAEVKLQASQQHESAAKTAAAAARESIQNLRLVFEAEQQKVDQSIGVREHKLRRKIHEVEAARERSAHDLSDLEQKYREWQQGQRKRTEDVIEKGKVTAAASEEFAARQKQVLDTAQAKVARDAQLAGDWDDWGGDVTSVSDESNDESVDA